MRLMNTNYASADATVVTASTSDSNFPASNLKHPFRSKRWRSTGIVEETIVFDLLTATEIDSVVLMWSKEDGVRLSNTAVVKIQANATNTWATPAVDITLSISNDYELASHYFTAVQNYRYWRVSIADPLNPYGYLELGVVWLGKALAVDNAQNGFEFSVIDRSKTVTTDFGHSYTDEYPLTIKLDFSYANLDYASVITLENAFRINGNRHPVMIVLDPEDAVFDKDHFALYGKFTNDFGLGHVTYNIFNIKGLSVVELS